MIAPAIDQIAAERACTARYYPDPSRAAARIKGHVAFSHGVRVEHARRR
jgi:uncharacterized protein (DUF427 family)